MPLVGMPQPETPLAMSAGVCCTTDVIASVVLAGLSTARILLHCARPPLHEFQ
jgi:hypothetical protein